MFVLSHIRRCGWQMFPYFTHHTVPLPNIISVYIPQLVSSSTLSMWCHTFQMTYLVLFFSCCSLTSVSILFLSDILRSVVTSTLLHVISACYDVKLSISISHTCSECFAKQSFLLEEINPLTNFQSIFEGFSAISPILASIVPL